MTWPHTNPWICFNHTTNKSALSCWKHWFWTFDHWFKLVNADSKVLYFCISALLVITDVSLLIQLCSSTWRKKQNTFYYWAADSDLWVVFQLRCLGDASSCASSGVNAGVSSVMCSCEVQTVYLLSPVWVVTISQQSWDCYLSTDC